MRAGAAAYGPARALSKRDMPLLETKYFGAMPYGEEAVYEFPSGLPAFENEKRFALLEAPDNAPLVFLQSAETPALCFLAFPILVVDREYRLAISPEDLVSLGLDVRRQPRIGAEVLALALLCVRDGFPVTANLLAAVVINVRNRRAVQAIRSDGAYSYQQPVAAGEAVGSC